LLTALSNFIKKYVFLLARAADGIAVWVLHTHCYKCFRHTPRLGFTSPTRRCGKTTALDALVLLVCKALATASITTAALFRTIEMAAPTLLIDEADTFLRDNEELRGAINAGHKQGGQVIRCVGDDAEPRVFGVFAPCAIAAIGRLPGTIEDRAIKVRMQRAKPGERPAMLDEAAEREGRELARQCARWAEDHRAALRVARPKLPSELFNRVADNWRPLFAIAAAAGGDWPERITAASAALAPEEDESIGIRLLADIRAIFEVRKTHKDKDDIASKDLCTALHRIETSPWAEYGKARKRITQRQLARVLEPFGITPSTVRLASEKTARGYRRPVRTPPSPRRPKWA
jgi:putative DNA primase/helicase